MSVKLVLNLEGPLQSWGESSKSGNRPTLDHPTKSGVVGILCAALGISMKTERAKVQELSKALSMDVVTVKKGSLLRDFQSIGANYDKDDSFEERALLRTTVEKKEGDRELATNSDGSPKTDIFTKEYLHDARFLVVLHTEEQVALDLLYALNNPKWPIFLGRKCCLPSSPVGVKVTETEEEANNLIASLAGGAGEVDYYREDPEGMPYMDEPLGGLKYGVRYVTKETRTF